MTEAFDGLRRRAEKRWAELQAKPWIRVGTGLLGEAAGALPVVAALRAELARHKVDATLSEVGTTGLCYAEPLVDVQVPGTPRVLYANVTPEQVSRIVEGHIKGGAHGYWSRSRTSPNASGRRIASAIWRSTTATPACPTASRSPNACNTRCPKPTAPGACSRFCSSISTTSRA